jgi:SpoIID/LytB domain protein
MRRAFFIPVLIGFAFSTAPMATSQAIGGTIGAPVVFHPLPKTTLQIEGKGPFHGSIEVRREGSGLTIVNDLALDQYVAGVREVPGGWPMEALKAQAVAARTYVLWEIEKGYWKRFGFDVCGTTSCQVYQGATAEQGRRGRRWLQAVRDTTGQVLLYQGRPALTRYHASSGGRTLPNEVVYPQDGPRPYLRAVDDPEDRLSPLHRWNVTFTRDHLQRILHDAIGLNGTLSDIRVTGRNMVLKTLGGELKMTTVRFRRVMSNTAPRVFPDLYPGPRLDGQRMPFTLASSRFTIEKAADGFVVHGMGYGHGVGMSQWGAKGRADAGQSYRQILAAYYGGLRPQLWTGTKTIRVAIVRGGPQVRVFGDGPFSVSAGVQTLSSSTLGRWTVAAAGARSLQVAPPRGYTLPLVLTGVRGPTRQLVDPPKEGSTLDVDFVVPKPAQVTGVLRSVEDGRAVARAKTVVEAGEQRLVVPFDRDRLPKGGRYRLDLRAFDGTKEVRAVHDVVLMRPASRLLLKAGIATFLALALYVAWRALRRRSAAVNRS